MIHLNSAQLPEANSILAAFKTLEEVITTAQTTPNIWADKGLDANCGLCPNVRELLRGKGADTYDLASYVVRTISTSWEHYTGCTMYPVPHPDTLACGSVRYPVDNAYRAYNRLPLYTEAYGELRLSLLRHWIAELQDAINKHAI